MWHDMDAAAALLGALTGHRSLRKLTLFNAHLRSLDFYGIAISHSCARDRLLPAVRANTSLRQLFVDEEHIWAQDADVEQLLFEAFALVNSRGGMRVE